MHIQFGEDLIGKGNKREHGVNCRIILKNIRENVL
jgi:hypothetical protein